MKRKIAGAIAAIMAITSVGALNVSAAAEISGHANGSYVVEEGSGYSVGTREWIQRNGVTYKTSDKLTSGANLTAPTRFYPMAQTSASFLPVGGSFEIQLGNSIWAYMSTSIPGTDSDATLTANSTILKTLGESLATGWVSPSAYLNGVSGAQVSTTPAPYEVRSLVVPGDVKAVGMSELLSPKAISDLADLVLALYGTRTNYNNVGLGDLSAGTVAGLTPTSVTAVTSLGATAIPDTKAAIVTALSAATWGGVFATAFTLPTPAPTVLDPSDAQLQLSSPVGSLVAPFVALQKGLDEGYYRYPTATERGTNPISLQVNKARLAYRMEFFPSNPTVARITYLVGNNATNNLIAGDGVEVSAAVVATNANVLTINLINSSNSQYTNYGTTYDTSLSSQGQGATASAGAAASSSNKYLPLSQISIRENTARSFPASPAATPNPNTPTGYAVNDINGNSHTFMKYGTAYESGSSTKAAYVIDAPADYAFSTKSASNEWTNLRTGTTNPAITAYAFYTNPVPGQENLFSRIVVFYDLAAKTSNVGETINIYNAVLYPLNEYTAGTDLSVSISNASEQYAVPLYRVVTSGGVSASANVGFMGTKGATTITPASIVVGKYTANPTQSIGYSATAALAIPAGYRNQKAATVTFKENAVDSWWASRPTRFYLADENGDPLTKVKFSYIMVNKRSGFDSAHAIGLGQIPNNNANALDEDNTTQIQYFEDDSTFGLRYLRQTDAYAKYTGTPAMIPNWSMASFELVPYISADLSFEGDVYLKVTTEGDYRWVTEGYVENEGLVKIATVAREFSYETTTTNLQIGSQRIDVKNVVITELKKGAAHASTSSTTRNITLSLQEYGIGNRLASDVTWVPNTAKVTVDSGNIDVTRSSTAADSTRLNIKVNKASTTVAAFTVSALEVRVNRTVPFGTYELSVAGNALRDNGLEDRPANYGVTATGGVGANAYYTGNYDFFNNYGFILDGQKYINVATESANNAFNNKVEVFNDGSDVIRINGVESTMGAPTENVEDHLYVPVRFLANALGAADSDIVWSELTRTVSIRLNGQKVTWTQDSPIYTLTNGAKEGMIDDMRCVNLNDRLYIPYRGFADAFNIPWAWDGDKQTATYNPSASQGQIVK